MIENHFSFRPKQAHSKRFRGQKRYYRRVMQKAQTSSLSLGNDDWFDCWHYHADWPGYGNLGWQHRRSHIEALCLVFRNIAQKVKSYSKPYQLWITLDLLDAGQDAVFFHTPNPQSDLPSHSRFPLQLSEVEWGFSEMEEFLGTRLSAMPLRAGIGVGKYRQIHIYSPSYGHPLE